MKYSFFSLLLLGLFTFSACNKGEDIKDFDKDDKKEDDWNKDDDKDKDGKTCFDLVYPVTYTMSDGSEVTGDDEKAVWTAIKAWYEAHPDSAEKPSLNYPVAIAYPDKDAPVAINSEEEMIEAKKECDEDKMKVCEWDGSKVSDPTVWEEYIVEPLVTDEACGGCTVSGEVKYMKIGTDFAYVIYYGKGECDEWAYLVTHYGDEKKMEEKCKFKLDCESGN